MWRSVLAVLLLPTLTSAQSEQTPPTPAKITTIQEPGIRTSEPISGRGSQSDRPIYQPYTFYDGIRRGRREEVAVQLSIAGLVTTPKSPVSGIVPLKLEMEPAEGLIYGTFRYPKAQPRKFKFQAGPVPVALWPVIRFDIQAARNASLGALVLHGKLTFQAIPYNGSGPGPVQQVDVQIPLTVVEHNAKVAKTRWPFPHTPVWVVVTLIVLSPVLVPLALVYYSLCAIEGPRNCPD